MFYNHIIKTPGEETFTLGEVIIRTWNYQKFGKKPIEGSEDHKRRLMNFAEYITDTRKRDGYENISVEAQVHTFLYENWEEYL